MVANGGGGVSSRSKNVSGMSLGSSGPNLTRRQVEFRVDRPVILPHLETVVQGSERRGWHLRHRWRSSCLIHIAVSYRGSVRRRWKVVRLRICCRTTARDLMAQPQGVVPFESSRCLGCTLRAYWAST
jgi:hypothetical protein